MFSVAAADRTRCHGFKLQQEQIRLDTDDCLTDNLGVLGSLHVKGLNSMRAVNVSLLLVYRSFLPSVVSKTPSAWQEESENFTHPRGKELVWVPLKHFP